MVKKISLMFSGGIDSTYAALMLAKKFDKVYLLTYSNGFGHYRMKNSLKRFKELNRLFPNKFIYNYFSIKYLFKKVLINNLDKDIIKYKGGFIWCFGCKLSMHTKTIIFNKKK